MTIKHIFSEGDFCPVAFCDRCGKRIEQGSGGRVLYLWDYERFEQVGKIAFFHTECLPRRGTWKLWKDYLPSENAIEQWDTLDNFSLSLAWNHGPKGPGVIGLLAQIFECDPPKTYNQISEIPRGKPGIYILYDEQGIKYIGQSKVGVRTRLEHHKASNHFSLSDIVKVTVIDIPIGKNKRESLEAALIWKLNPRLNLQWKRRA